MPVVPDNVTISELLKIWGELCVCLESQRYGADATIYAHRVSTYSPTVHGGNMDEKCDTFKEHRREVVDGAAEAICDIVRAFAKEYECDALIDSMKPTDWLARQLADPSGFTHRCCIYVSRDQPTHVVSLNCQSFVVRKADGDGYAVDIFDGNEVLNIAPPLTRDNFISQWGFEPEFPHRITDPHKAFQNGVKS